MNILLLYNATQTYTSTVFEHVASLSRYSAHNFFYQHQDPSSRFNVDLSRFDAIIIHYTIRLPFDHVADSTAKALEEYQGLKGLFIQDEYDHPNRTGYWIKRLGIGLVFTVVPSAAVTQVYPPEEFPGVRFVNMLTGYVPEELSSEHILNRPSGRKLVVGYRGRPLPIRYGRLGQEKIEIGRVVKEYCELKGIRSDIAWTEDARIYGPQWYEFMASCRATLGTESGSNVFDWDGTLARDIEDFRKANASATDEDVYREVVKAREMPGLMNQISPRIFEAIASRTALVLFEGGYSGAVTPGLHFIPLKKDGSNLDEVFALLQDDEYVDEMTARAHQAVIASGTYSYEAFVRIVDEHMEQLSSRPRVTLCPQSRIARSADAVPTPITTSPIRAVLPSAAIETLRDRGLLASLATSPTRAAPPSLPSLPTDTLANTLRGAVGLRSSFRRLVRHMWGRLPEGVRKTLKPGLKTLLGRE